MSRVIIEGRMSGGRAGAIPVQIALSVSADDDPAYATAVVDLELGFPHGPVTGRALTGRRYLPRFALALRQLIGAVGPDADVPQDYESYLLKTTGEAGLADWD